MRTTFPVRAITCAVTETGVRISKAPLSARIKVAFSTCSIPVVVFLTIPVIATVRLAEISAIVYLPLASGVRAFPFTVTTGTDWS